MNFIRNQLLIKNVKSVLQLQKCAFICPSVSLSAAEQSKPKPKFNGNVNTKPKAKKQVNKQSEATTNKLTNLLTAKLVIKKFKDYNSSQVMLEGKKLLIDAVNSNNRFEFERLLYTEKNQPFVDSLLKAGESLEKALVLQPDQLIKISDEQANKLADCKTPDGLIAFGKVATDVITNHNKKSMSVLLENVKDPGNVGTVIRTSAGLGFSQVLLTKESANPWQPKVIRSGMGSHFKISVMDDIEFNADYVKSLIERKTLFIVTHCANKLGSNSTNITELSALSQTMTGLGATTFDNLILIVGNESRGVERTTMDMLEQLKASVITLTIPLENALDSLSCPVAFGIIGHELKKVFLV